MSYKNQLTYQEFRKEFEEQRPSSVPVYEVEMNEYQSWARWAVLLTFVCAAMVSGVHTVPTVWKGIEVNEIITSDVRNIVSVASLFAIELAILLSAYLMAKGVKLAYAVMGVASTVAVMANLYSVISALADGGDPGALIVAIVMGIGAPLIALFSGKMFVDIHRADRVQDARARKIYKEACIAWDKEVEKAWKASQRSPMSNRVSTEPLSNVSNGLSIGQPMASTIGHTKVPDASRMVHDYLTDNPDALSMSPRVLAGLLGVGKSTVNNVQREMREKVLSNGHGAHIQ